MTKQIGLFLFILVAACSSMAQKSQSVFFGQASGITGQNTAYVDTGLTSEVSKLKSENKAFNLSLWSTLIPTITIVASPLGLIAGPSMGYFYGGAPGRGWLGIGIRTAGVGGMIVSFAASWDCSGSECGTGLAFFTLGAAITVGSAIYDIATVKSIVRKHNQSLRKTGWMITPKFLAKHKAGILELRLRF